MAGTMSSACRIILAGVLFFSFLLGIYGYASAQPQQQRGMNEQAKLKQEIQLLNLLSGLYLTDEQMLYLISKAKELESLKKRLREKAQRQTQAQTETLQELKQELEEYETDGEVSEEVAKQVHQSGMELRKLRVEYDEKMDNITEEVKGNLTSTQLHIIEEFVPCLVPPKGPARFGQAAAAEAGAQKTQQLERIRAMSELVYEKRKYTMVERALETARLYANKQEEFNEDELKDRLLAIFDEARKLSDIDFGWRKDQLALELKECIFPEHKGGDIDQRIQKFLLSPTAIEVLEGELAKKTEEATTVSE
ncbi:MAG: hypothetical protein JW869_08740 [Candidatus Omnitrophica bacterium]|nr:hypothetical protein [Candidatus Omnitrophota bacterium]